MEKLHYSIVIDAPREKVWDTMLGEDSYPAWTEVFQPGSHYVGDWSQGSKILFLAPDESGEMSGMVGRVEENRPYEYISVEHLGVVQEGREDTSSQAVKDWAGAHENYTLRETDGKTEVLVDLDSSAEFTEMFEDQWPQALTKLKELAEE
ncbi:MAG: SRPBCC domain-containing protein [Thermoleophilia bacterium]|nr:SRPBCC domain-containing protein [Thermoleophilia bacterium]